MMEYYSKLKRINKELADAMLELQKAIDNETQTLKELREMYINQDHDCKRPACRYCSELAENGLIPSVESPKDYIETYEESYLPDNENVEVTTDLQEMI